MTLQEARKIIRDQSASYSQQVEAAAALSSSKQSEIGDLIRCLRLGGLPAETAATLLYARTGRPYSGHVADFSTNAEEWSQYLARQLKVAN